MRAELAQEASELRGRLGFQGRSWIRALPIYLLLIGVFGVFLPWEKGRDFLDAVMLGAYACLGVVFAAPAAAAPFEKVPTIKRALARIFISVFYGELVTGAMLLLGMITVYVSRAGRIVVGPDLRSLAECAALGLTLSLAACTAASWISLRFSPGAAKGVVRVVFLGLLAAFYLRSGWLPTIALRGAGIALLASILFSLALRTTLAAGGRSRNA
ncbi:MAG TPA: hypothetical protein VE958_04810 [Bryobacteraceae bacterium]|jgi:hypothetical protein|nr:hypothetical protein [Bryobacteraceae bacterium]